MIKYSNNILSYYNNRREEEKLYLSNFCNLHVCDSKHLSLSPGGDNTRATQTNFHPNIRNDKLIITVITDFSLTLSSIGHGLIL